MDIKCCHCGSRDVVFYAQINMNGAKVVTARCEYCGRIPEKGKPFYPIANFEWDRLPLIQNRSLFAEPCEVKGCTEIGSEYHHYSPRHLFGDASEDWKTGYLCRKHHREWHDKVTPDMARKHGTNS